jgi:hypothetical protein
MVKRHNSGSGAEPWRMAAAQWMAYTNKGDYPFGVSDEAVERWQAIEDHRKRLVGPRSGKEILEAADKYGHNFEHRWIVESALREGRHVPAEVLAGYPDLGRQANPGREPWQMTRAEYESAENTVKVRAIQEAIVAGRPIILSTYMHRTRLTSPDHIKVDSAGDVRIPSGRKWLALTPPQVDSLAAQAGIEPVPFMERVYHHELVEQALDEGKPVPDEVLADYPDLSRKANPEEDDLAYVDKLLAAIRSGKLTEDRFFDWYIRDWMDILSRGFSEQGIEEATWRNDIRRQVVERMGWSYPPRVVVRREGRLWGIYEPELVEKAVRDWEAQGRSVEWGEVTPEGWWQVHVGPHANPAAAPANPREGSMDRLRATIGMARTFGRHSVTYGELRTWTGKEAVVEVVRGSVYIKPAVLHDAFSRWLLDDGYWEYNRLHYPHADYSDAEELLLAKAFIGGIKDGWETQERNR